MCIRPNSLTDMNDRSFSELSYSDVESFQKFISNFYINLNSVEVFLKSLSVCLFVCLSKPRWAFEIYEYIIDTLAILICINKIYQTIKYFIGIINKNN